MGARKTVDVPALLAFSRRVLAADLDWMKKMPETNQIALSLHETLIAEIDEAVRVLGRKTRGKK